jgi:hypothetical protein
MGVVSGSFVFGHAAEWRRELRATCARSCDAGGERLELGPVRDESWVSRTRVALGASKA